MSYPVLAIRPEEQHQLFCGLQVADFIGKV